MITQILPIAPLINAEYPGIQSDWLDKLRDIIAHINANIDNINDLQKQSSGSAEDLIDISNRLGLLEVKVQDIGETLTSQQTDISTLKEDMLTVQDNISTIQGTLTDHATAISNLNKSVNEINDKIESINSQIVNINNSINEIVDDITDLKSLTAQHNTQIGTLNTAVDKLMDDMTAAEEDITTLKSETAEHTQQITDIMTDIGKLTTAVTDLETDLKSVNDTLSDRIESLQTAVQTNTNAISLINLNVGHLQDDIKKLEDSVTSNDTNISDIQTKINLINDDLDTIQEDVSVNTQAITRIDQTITHLSTDMDNLSTTVAALAKVVGNLQPGEIPSFSESGTAGQVWTKGTETNSIGAWADIPDALRFYKNSGSQGQVLTKGSAGSPGVWADPGVSSEDIDNLSKQLLSVSESVQDIESAFKTGSPGQFWTRGGNADALGEWSELSSFQFYSNPSPSHFKPSGWSMVVNFPYRLTITLSDISVDIECIGGATRSVFSNGNGQIYVFDIGMTTGVALLGIYSITPIVTFPSITDVALYSMFDGGTSGQVWTNNGNVGAWTNTFGRHPVSVSYTAPTPLIANHLYRINFKSGEACIVLGGGRNTVEIASQIFSISINVSNNTVNVFSEWGTNSPINPVIVSVEDITPDGGTKYKALDYRADVPGSGSIYAILEFHSPTATISTIRTPIFELSQPFIGSVSFLLGIVLSDDQIANVLFRYVPGSSNYIMVDSNYPATSVNVTFEYAS